MVCVRVELLPACKKTIVRTFPLAEVRCDGIWVGGSIEMEIVSTFAQRAGGADQGAAIARERQQTTTVDVVSCNYSTSIDCKLSKEVGLPVFVRVWCLQLKDVTAIVKARN